MEHVGLEPIEQVARIDVNGRVQPDGRVDDVPCGAVVVGEYP